MVQTGRFLTFNHLSSETVLKTYKDEIPIIGWLIAFCIKTFGLTPAEGALNPLFAATSPLVKSRGREFGGAYLEPVGKLVKPKAGGDDPFKAKQLWESSERAVQAM